MLVSVFGFGTAPLTMRPSTFGDDDSATRQRRPQLPLPLTLDQTCSLSSFNHFHAASASVCLFIALHSTTTTTTTRRATRAATSSSCSLRPQSQCLPLVICIFKIQQLLAATAAASLSSHTLAHLQRSSH